MTAINNDVVMIRAYSGGRWFFYTFFFVFNIILIIGAFKFEFRRNEIIEIGKFFIAMNLVTVYVVYILEAFKIQYNQTSFSYRSSFQRHYHDISYSLVERLWIEFERKPFQALDTGAEVGAVEVAVAQFGVRQRHAKNVSSDVITCRIKRRAVG